MTPVVLPAGSERSVPVPARPSWCATGILLEGGVTYRARADGVWSDWRTECDAAGYPSPNPLFRLVERLRRHPSAPWFALVATVDRRRNTRFVIGTGTEFVAPASGQLVCYANDLPWFRFNNSGEVRLTVTRP